VANVTSPAVSCTPNSTPQYTVTVNVSGFASGPTLVFMTVQVSPAGCVPTVTV